MAIGGTSSKPVFVKDGMYLSMITDNIVTIGNVVQITSTGTDTCDVGAANKTCAGVCVGGNRFSRTSTDNAIAAGNKATICTRGIVNVYTGTSTIVRGSLLEMGAGGIVELNETAGTLVPGDVIGIALEGNSGAAATIRMQLRL